MQLIQILLPLDAGGADAYREIRHELLNTFGGLTAYMQSPAEGLWRDANDHTEKDRIVVVEVMVETIDRDWWSAYRKHLETRLAQKDIVIRSLALQLL